MDPIVIDQIVIDQTVMAWILSVLVLIVTAVILLRWVKHRKRPMDSTDATTFRLMTAEEVAKSAGTATGGLSRAHAFEILSGNLPRGGDLVTGVTTTPLGSISDWHYHPNWATIAYVLQGNIRVEFGPGGKQAVEAKPGDFLFVPPGGGDNIHREQNIGDGEQILIVFRVGIGPVANTVDGPVPA